MSLSFPVEFDDPITSTVTVALIPVDRFSRIEIQTGVSAQLWDTERDRPLPYDLIRSRSGYLVLVDQPADAEYTFRVDAGLAGYSGPIDVTINPAADGIRQIVRLDPKPTFGFDADITLVRGVVVVGSLDPAGPEGLDRAVVSVVGERFQTSTDARGGFALPLQLPQLVVGEAIDPVEVEIQVSHADHAARSLSVTLLDRQTHIFAEPIHLDGDNNPPFIQPNR